MLALVLYQHVGLWVGAILTLAIFSFLYKDNPVYKLAEHVFVGVAAGWTVAYTYWSAFVPNLWTPLDDLFHGKTEDEEVVWSWLLVVPATLGLLFFARFTQKWAWLSRWSIAFLVGTYAGVNLTGMFQTNLILQAKATFVNLNPNGFPAGVNGMEQVFLYNLPILFGVLACLTYFFFSKPHAGFIGVTARIGIFFLMAAFGASFGYTVMARISLFIGRLQFLFSEWLGQYFESLRQLA
jgi:hypothetical protein